MLLNPEFSTTWTPRLAVFPNSSKVFCRMSDNTLFQKNKWSPPLPMWIFETCSKPPNCSGISDICIHIYICISDISMILCSKTLHLWSKLIGVLISSSLLSLQDQALNLFLQDGQPGWLSLAFSQRLESEPTSFKNWTKDWRLYKLETLKIFQTSQFSSLAHLGGIHFRFNFLNLLDLSSLSKCFFPSSSSQKDSIHTEVLNTSLYLSHMCIIIYNIFI